MAAARTVDSLIVEDEPELQDAIVTRLSLDGLEAIGLSSAEAARRWLTANTARVLILDLNLPGEDGMEWLREMQRPNSMGVIIITGRSEARARVEGRELGADDYLAKPLNLEEVALTVRNLLQRLPITHGWELDMLNWRLAAPEGASIPLTASELAVLDALTSAPGEPVDRRVIIDHLGADPDTYDSRRMEVMIRRLRAKIESHTGDAAPIQTARGVGYSFTAPVEVRHPASGEG